MVSTDNTVKLAPGVTSVVKLAEGPVQEMVGTGLPCAVQLNVAWLDWFTVRSTGGPRIKGWAGWRGGAEKVADSESGTYSVWVEESRDKDPSCSLQYLLQGTRYRLVIKELLIHSNPIVTYRKQSLLLCCWQCPPHSQPCMCSSLFRPRMDWSQSECSPRLVHLLPC